MGKKNLIIFIILTILVVSFGYFFWIKQIDENKFVFNSSGYIIAKKQGNDVKETSTRFYFNEGTTYKNSVNNMITFKDSEKDAVKVDKASFLHYTDESIGVLKKSVILNLEFIKNSSIVYYNLIENANLQRKENSYYISHLNNELKFDYFVIKISDSKYLLYAPLMTIKIDGKNNEVKNNYLELSFLDGDIIRLENQEQAFQNVSSKMEIEFSNGIVLNLKDRNFYINNEMKLALGEITINSDDNIEIKETSTTTKKTTKKTTTKSTKAKTTSPIGNLGDGKLNNSDDSEKEVNNLEKQSEPIYSLSDMEVTTSGIYANVNIKDDYSMLAGDSIIKIVDISTGKKVYETTESLLTYNFSIECNSLMQDRSYVLSISSEYIRKGVVYTKDFVQKTFRTESIGIDVEKDYASSNKLAFKLVESSFNEVTGLTVTLKKGDESTSIKFAREDGKLQPISTDKDFVFETLGGKALKPNTTYTISLSNFVFSNSNMSYSQHYIEKTYKTLKTNPKLLTPSYEIDKRNSMFILSPGKITDIDEGIQKYRYEIYNVSDCNESRCENPVKIIEKNDATQSKIPVVSAKDAKEDSLIKTNSYVYRIVAEFNDNEKIVEYSSDLSSAMILSGVNPPTLIFMEDESTIKSESIIGTVKIIDKDNTILSSTSAGKKISNFNIIYSNSAGDSLIETREIETLNNNEELEIPIEWNNLKSNITYTVSIYSDVDLKDGNIYENYFIGSFKFNTPLADPLKAVINMSDNIEQKFEILFNLQNAEGNNTTESIDISNKLVVNLYSGLKVDKVPIGTYTLEDENPSYYESSLKGDVYDEILKLDPSSFKNSNGEDLTDDIKRGETYTIGVELTDYTVYENEIPVEVINGTFTATSNLEAPDDVNKAINVKGIFNQDLGFKPYEDKKQDDSLNGTTIVGYNIEAYFDASNDKASKIIYHVHRLNNKTGEYEKLNGYSKEIDISDKDGNLDISHTYWLEKVDENNLFTRGYTYFFSYEIITTEGKVWPGEGKLYRSLGQETPKQSPVFKIYPKSSNLNDNLGEYKIKYYYKDVDKAVVDNKVYYNCDSNDCNFVLVSEQYKEETLKRLNNKDVDIHYFENLVGTSEKKSLLNNLKIDNDVPDMTNIKYNIEKDENGILISKSNLVFEFEMTAEQYNRIVKAKLILNYDDKMLQKNLGVVNIKDANVEPGYVRAKVTLNLYDIMALKGKKITPKLSFVYDSGKAGFDYIIDDEFIYQTTEVESRYYTGQSYSEAAKNSLFSLKEKNQLLIDMEKYEKLNTIKYNKEPLEIPYEINEKGIRDGNTSIYWHPKKVDIVDVKSTSDDNDFMFNDVTPVIRVLDENIIKGISQSTIKVEYIGGTDELYNTDKLYLRYCESYDDLCKNDGWKNVESELKDSNSIFNLMNLEGNTKYIFEVFAKRKTDKEEFVQLVDIEEQEPKSYYFTTAQNIDVSEFNVAIAAKSYEEKNLVISYNKSNTMGYDGIRYEICKGEPGKDFVYSEEKCFINWEENNEYSNGEIVTNITSVKSLNEINNNNVGFKYEAGSKYYIILKPYFDDDNNVRYYMDKFQYEHDFKILPHATFDVSYEVSKTKENYVNFNISYNDVWKTIEAAKYNVQIVESDTNEIVYSEEIKESEINGTSKIIEMEYKTGFTYTLKIIYKEDLYATFNSIQKIYIPPELSNFIPSKVNLGKVSLNFVEDKVYLMFEKSEGLEFIKTIVYTNYYDDGCITKTIDEGNVNFQEETINGKKVFVLQLQESAFPDKISLRLAISFLGEPGEELARKDL